jgi:hypothetical protein
MAIGRRFFFVREKPVLQGRPFDPIADRLRKVAVYDARGCGSLPSPSSSRPRAVPKIRDGRRAATVGSELDNAEDNFAAGMAGLVEALGRGGEKTEVKSFPHSIREVSSTARRLEYHSG